MVLEPNEKHKNWVFAFVYERAKSHAIAPHNHVGKPAWLMLLRFHCEASFIVWLAAAYLFQHAFKVCINHVGRLHLFIEVHARWSGDVMKRPGHKIFNAVSHNRSRPEVLFLNLTWWSSGPREISSVLLQLLLVTFSNSKFGRHGEWSVTFWQWENNS